MRKMLRRSISSLTAIAMAFGSLPARANPLGGQVVTGTAAITGTGSSQVTINQSSAKAIIDWRSFNIGAGETTTFVQPNSSAVTLNRVTGGLGLSTINGMINANGGVYVVNPDGILFGPNSKINVGSFLGTTHDIANSDFMVGKYNFTISGNPSASIVNQGSITAASGGFAALVAPGVRNDGIINARLGTVALASGNGFTLDLYGDNLIKLQPSDAIANDVIDAATGQTMTSLVQNTGTLKANGGTVSLSAVTARKVLDSVINSSGTVEANSVGTKNGLVVFGAQTAATKQTNAPTQTVKVSGKIKAAGKKTGTTGGKIQVTGENIQLASADLDASGQAGGGKILIGGDWKGGDPTGLAVTMYGQSFEAAPVPTATQVTVDAYSVLNASAIKTGNGGKVVVWSNDATSYAGSILAMGGTVSGNGGFIETSGHTLNIDGSSVSTATPAGQVGHWLLDPSDYTIDTTTAATIEEALETGDVVIATTNDGNPGNGDIIVNSGIAWSTNSFLLLDAYHGVTVNGPISGSNIGFVTNNGGTGGNLTINAPVSPTASLAINGTPYTLINTQQELQDISPTNNNGYVLYGNYALASDIILTGSFVPIGGTYSGDYFNGIFEGLGHKISGLTVANASPWTNNLPGDGYYLGLFGSMDGNIENLTITSANITLSGSGGAGILAGSIGGTVYNVSVSGVVSGPSDIGGLAGGSDGGIYNSNANVAVISTDGAQLFGWVGGLVGVNQGYISNSYSTGTVTVTHTGSGYGSPYGGLVGENEPNAFTINGVYTQNNPGVSNSYSTSSVIFTGIVDSYGNGYDFSSIGGLIGTNFANNATGYATGTIQINSCPNCFVYPVGLNVISTPSTITTLQAQAAATAALVAAATTPAPATPAPVTTPSGPGSTNNSNTSPSNSGASNTSSQNTSTGSSSNNNTTGGTTSSTTSTNSTGTTASTSTTQSSSGSEVSSSSTGGQVLATVTTTTGSTSTSTTNSSCPSTLCSNTLLPIGGNAQTTQRYAPPGSAQVTLTKDEKQQLVLLGLLLIPIPGTQEEAGVLLTEEAIAALRTASVLKAADFTTAEGEAVFWTGLGDSADEVAANYATGAGRTTLEMRLRQAGIRLPPYDPTNPEVVAVWDQASLLFAQGAKGDITVLVSDSTRMGSTWKRIEYPALIENANVDSITALNPATGQRVTLFTR